MSVFEQPISGYLRLSGRTGSGQTLVQVLGESLAHSGCPPVSLACRGFFPAVLRWADP